MLAFDITGNHGRVLSLYFAVALIFLLALPLAVPLYVVLFKSKSNSDTEQPSSREPLLAPQKSSMEKQEAVTAIVKEEDAERNRKPVIGEERTVVQTIQTYDFWILFASFLCGVGTGMCVMNNIGQMGLALGFNDASIFVSLMSIWGFFGRIVSGLLSEYYIWYVCFLTSSPSKTIQVFHFLFHGK